MKRTILTLVTAVSLAVPAAAFACEDHRDQASVKKLTPMPVR